MPKDLKSYYLKFGRYTDPGRNVSLYDTLPDTIEDVVKLVKKQLIHPTDARATGFKARRSTRRDTYRIRTVKQILLGLLVQSPEGLTMQRPSKHRLVLSCDHHAILCASMLRHRGFSTRVRAGFAYYIVPHLPTSHWLCETWIEKEQRWIYVDPERQIIDVSRDDFKLAGEIWQGMREKRIDTHTFQIQRRKGLSAVKPNLLHDLNAVFHNEMLHYQWLNSRIKEEPALYYKSPSRLNKSDKALLDTIAAQLTDLDTHFESLWTIYEQHFTEVAVTLDS